MMKSITLLGTMDFVSQVTSDDKERILVGGIEDLTEVFLYGKHSVIVTAEVDVGKLGEQYRIHI